MTIQDLGALGEFLGSIVVLVTLAYLAYQTRQNTQAIAAQLDGARLNATMTMNMTLATSGELQEALIEDRVSEIGSNQMKRNNYWTGQLNLVAWNLTQYRKGILPSFHVDFVERVLRFQFRDYRTYGEFWDAVKGSYSPEFVAFVEEQRTKAA